MVAFAPGGAMGEALCYQIKKASDYTNFERYYIFDFNILCSRQ
jgi:hypothetical protein